MSFRCFLKMAKDSAVQIEIGRLFHQLVTVQEKVCESDLMPLWDGTINKALFTSRTQASGGGGISLN